MSEYTTPNKEKTEQMLETEEICKRNTTEIVFAIIKHDKKFRQNPYDLKNMKTKPMLLD